MKKIINLILAAILLGSTPVFAGFSDVSNYKENTFTQFINWLEDQGVVQGYSDGTFRPGNYINRAEFLKMLYGTIGMSDSKAVLPFPDVPLSEWYTKYIREAYATGVVQGYPDGYFRPENYINFAEALKIVMNGFFDVNGLYGDGVDYDSCGVSLDSYSGVNTSAWYWKYIHVADELCMLKYDLSSNVWEYQGGDPVPYLVDYNPGAYITRADMAALLFIAKAVKDNGTIKFNSYSMFPVDISHAGNLSSLSSSSSLCTDPPTSTDIGRDVYPIDPKYDHLPFLGQIFTAYDCGSDRVNQLFGMDNGNYTLGSYIELQLPDATDTDIDSVLEDIGYVCMGGYTYCDVWQLEGSVDVDDLIKLKGYAEVIYGEDCVNCG